MLRALIIISALITSTISSHAVAQSKIMIVTWRGCEEACQGFQDYLIERGFDAEIILRDANQKKDTLPKFLAEARSDGVELIVTWGTSVTRGIVGTLSELDNPAFNHDIPSVFMIVADPVGGGIVKSLNSTGRTNVTGTYNRVPEEVNIQTIRAYLPRFKRLGMLYHADEKNSVLKRDEIAALAGKMGFDLTALELPLGENGKPQAKDIAPKIAALKTANVDFFYFGSSSFLRSHHEVVTAAAFENRIPTLSPYEQLVRKSQALISVAARYYDVGRLAGRQAEKILSGTSAGALPVLPLTNFAVVINMTVAKKIKLFPPLELLQVAEKVD